MARTMKDSGVEWIGKIPVDWEVKRLKYSCETRKTKYSKEFGELDYFGLENIVSESGEFIYTSNEYDLEQSQLCMKNDVVFGKLRPYLAKVFLVDKDRCCSGEFAVFTKFDGVEIFYKYLFLSYGFIKVVDASTYGTKMPRANIEFINNMYIPVPPSDTQQKIAEFLDSKVAEINEILSKTRKSIEEYKLYKQAVITEVVTKGLDSTVPMKDSGIEWIGKIPKDWKTVKIKYTSWLKGRIGWQGLKSNEYQDEGAYLITGTDFSNGMINWDSCVHISDERFEEAPEIHIKEADLLITKDGTIGKVAIAKDCPEKVSLNSGVLLIRNTKDFKYHDKYLYFVLLSNQFWVWYEMSQTGNSTIKHLYQEQFYNFEFTYPSMGEQQRIAEYLEKQVADIDDLIAKKEAFVEEMEVYKKSLIYEYVTGKKEVV